MRAGELHPAFDAKGMNEADAVLLGDFFVSGSAGADFVGLSKRKAIVRSGHPVSFGGITHVIERGAGRQMLRVYATGIVARVENHSSARQRTVVQFVRQAMSADITARPPSEPDNAIAADLLRPDPFPAFFVGALFNLFPKPLRDGAFHAAV